MKVYAVWLRLNDYDACPTVCGIALTEKDAREYALKTIPTHDIELFFGYIDIENIIILPFNADGKAMIKRFNQELGNYTIEEMSTLEVKP